MKERACKNCGLIIADELCPECKTMSGSEDWMGEAIILDPGKSKIAKTMDIEKPGRYALKVR